MAEAQVERFNQINMDAVGHMAAALSEINTPINLKNNYPLEYKNSYSLEWHEIPEDQIVV